jgi:hypothetical protein
MSRDLARIEVPRDVVVELEIERTRERILESIRRLRTEMSDATDWRKHYARRPWIFLAGALGLGFGVGWALGKGKEQRS